MKYLKFLLLAIMFSLFICVPCYASETTDYINGVLYLPEFTNLSQFSNYSDYIVTVENYKNETSDWIIYLVLTNSNEVTHYQSLSNIYKVTTSFVYFTTFGSSSWRELSHGEMSRFHIGQTDLEKDDAENRYVVYSSSDLIYKSSGQVVFPRAPIQSKGLIKITRFQVLRALTQMVYLVPCLILCVICLAAFRKVWIWLKMQLLGL